MTHAIVLAESSGAIVAAHEGAYVANPAQVYLESLGSEHSRRTMRWALNLAAKLMQAEVFTFPWATLDGAQVAWLRAQLLQRYKASTGNLVLSGVRGVVLACWRMGVMDDRRKMQIDDVPGLQGTSADVGLCLTPVQVSLLLDIARGRREDLWSAPGLFALRDPALLLVMLGMGLRRHEAVGLAMEDWHPEAFREQGGMVVRGKGQKEVLMPMHPATRLGLDRWLERRGKVSGALFPRLSVCGQGWVAGDGGFLSDAWIYHFVKHLGELAGIPRLRPHDLRRTFGTSLLQAGVDALVVQRLMRHASASTTARYDKRDADELAKKIAYLPLGF